MISQQHSVRSRKGRTEGSQISSSILLGSFIITRDVTVQRLEFLTEIPSIFAIHRNRNAFVLDLQDNKFEITDKNKNWYTVDALIKNKDNDSWTGNTGTGQSMVPVNFEPDAPAILCRRSRLNCKGCFVCERIDPLLLAVERFDLDSVSRDAALAAQKETCRNEGTTTENNAAVFMDVIFKRTPISQTDNTSHVAGSSTIPAPHPERSTFRDNVAHNHPMLALTKPSFEAQAICRDCIKATGCVGASVSKVDQAPSTKILFGGKSPAEFASPLQAKQTKR
ncbi:hypothetical protein C8J57DRAFT_1537166 [Mycena rebaudengoi]|nr:hypothetical protein C8J57DRAFT_1537166 [Mycena rebaudengoi]